MAILNDVIESVPQVGSLTPLGYGPTVVNFFDFFFGDNAGIPQDNFRTFFQWTVANGSVDLVGGVGPGVFGAPPAQPSGRYVDLGGSTGDPARFETTLAFPVVAGQTYNFTFDYRSTGGDLNTATAFLGDRSYTVSSSSENFTRFSDTFTATETGVVRIAFQGDDADTDNSGIGIDGVLFGQVVGDPTTPPVVGPGDGTNPAVPMAGATNDADNLSGTAGPDRIEALMGNDTVTAGQGNDTVYGNQGNDQIFGNQGADLIYGGQGADTVYGGQDNDIVYGNLGDDQLFGNQGNDQLFGNEGADFLHGGQGNDSLYGGQDNDVLNGGVGDDILFGGLGADTFVFASGQGNDTIGDFNAGQGDIFDLQGQTVSSVTANGDGDAILALSGGGTITLLGIPAEDFSLAA